MDKKKELCKIAAQILNVANECGKKDVLERKKGKWRETEMNRVKCTECNYICDISAKFLYSYCPNCGAKMEVEK